MKVNIEKRSGFCYGVRRVVEMAEELLEQGREVYCLKEIVHNQKEVQRLRDKGLIFIDHDDLKNLKDTTLMIRAHGEPPETYSIAEKNNLQIIDGTCPIVEKIQKKIKNQYAEMNTNYNQILIYGKEGHPEVRGLRGQTKNEAIVVRDESDLENLDPRKSVYLYSQTTMDTTGFKKLAEQLRSTVKEVRVNDTICRHISHREPGLRKFSSENDMIIFVSGKKSSNGRILFEVCKDENPNSHFISGPEELIPDWFVSPLETIGICGATSTPSWLLEEVADEIKGFTEN